jgi:hypothetical protein
MYVNGDRINVQAEAAYVQEGKIEGTGREQMYTETRKDSK